MPTASFTGLQTVDLTATMRAIEEMHQCKLDIVLTVEDRHGAQLVCVMTARQTTGLPPMRGATPGKPPLCATMEIWPLPADPERLYSCLYRHLLEMDGKLSREFWQQQLLPGLETPERT